MKIWKKAYNLARGEKKLKITKKSRYKGLSLSQGFSKSFINDFIALIQFIQSCYPNVDT